MANKVTVSGTLSFVKSGTGGKGPWAFATIQPEGEPGRFGIIAFDESASALAQAGDGASVQIDGKLWRKKDNRSEVWETVIRAESVSA